MASGPARERLAGCSDASPPLRLAVPVGKVPVVQLEADADRQHADRVQICFRHEAFVSAQESGPEFGEAHGSPLFWRASEADCRQPHGVDLGVVKTESAANGRDQRVRAVEGEARHAPASGPKPAELAEKLLESWDEAYALSRANLRRRFVAITRSSAASAGTDEAVAERLSRAGLVP